MSIFFVQVPSVAQSGADLPCQRPGHVSKGRYTGSQCPLFISQNSSRMLQLTRVLEMPFPTSMKSSDGDFVSTTYCSLLIVSTFSRSRRARTMSFWLYLKAILILLPLVVPHHVKNGNKILISTAF